MGSGTSLSARIARNNPLRYILAIAVLLAAVAICVGVSVIVGDRFAYALLLPAVAFAAWYCGSVPAILTIVLALVGAVYGFHPNVHPLRISAPTDWLGMLVFVASSALVILMGAARRRENAALWKAQDELELKVQERTADLDSVNCSLRELSARLMQLQDDERRRIARELHDSVGQLLAAVTMNLASARTEASKLNSSLAATLDDSSVMVAQVSREIRTISHLLHPPLLDVAGLCSAIRWYVDGFSDRSRIKVDLDLASDLGRLSTDTEIAVFRVVQECLTNVYRHSGSDSCAVKLERQQDVLRLEVRDCGHGMPKSSNGIRPSGFGLRGMEERLRQLGGSLKIDSCDTGTTIVASLPISEARSESAA